MMSKRWTFIAAATFVATTLATPTFSAEERFSGDVVQIVPDGQVHNTTLSIAGPGGYYAQAYAKAGMPMIKLSQHGTLADGIYIWQVTAATDDLIEVRDKGPPASRCAKIAFDFAVPRISENGTQCPCQSAVERPLFLHLQTYRGLSQHGRKYRFADIRSWIARVCSGSSAKVASHVSDVRYAPESGSRKTPVALPLCANNGHSVHFIFG